MNGSLVDIMAKCCVVFSQSPFEDLTAFHVRHVLLLVSIFTSNAPGQCTMAHRGGDCRESRTLNKVLMPMSDAFVAKTRHTGYVPYLALLPYACIQPRCSLSLFHGSLGHSIVFLWRTDQKISIWVLWTHEKLAQCYQFTYRIHYNFQGLVKQKFIRSLCLIRGQVNLMVIGIALGFWMCFSMIWKRSAT